MTNEVKPPTAEEKLLNRLQSIKNDFELSRHPLHRPQVECQLVAIQNYLLAETAKLQSQLAAAVECLTQEAKPCGCCLAEFNCQVNSVIADLSQAAEAHNERMREEGRQEILKQKGGE